MIKATEIGIIHPRILFVSGYGGGKTHSIGLIHKAYKAAGTKGVYLFDCDKGTPTLKNNGFDVDLNYYVDKNPQDPVAWEKLTRDLSKFENTSLGYGAIAFDSLTSLQSIAMNWVIKINPLKGRRFQLTTENDYGVLVGMMNQFFPKLLNISDHMGVIVTSHIRLMEDNMTQQVRYFPAITGKALPSSIGLWFNEAWWIRNEGYGEACVRVAQTAKDDKIDLKTQISEMPFKLPINDAIAKLVASYGIIPGSMLVSDIKKEAEKGEEVNVDKVEGDVEHVIVQRA